MVVAHLLPLPLPLVVVAHLLPLPLVVAVEHLLPLPLPLPLVVAVEQLLLLLGTAVAHLRVIRLKRVPRDLPQVSPGDQVRMSFNPKTSQD